MPLEWRLQVLQARLRSESPTATVSPEVLTALEPEALTAVLDALGAGGEFPVVLVEDEVACSGGIDAEAVLGCVRTRATG